MDYFLTFTAAQQDLYSMGSMCLHLWAGSAGSQSWNTRAWLRQDAGTVTLIPRWRLAAQPIVSSIRPVRRNMRKAVPILRTIVLIMVA